MKAGLIHYWGLGYLIVCTINYTYIMFLIINMNAKLFLE